MAWLQRQTKLFRALLYCYPAEFRHEYGAEMEQLFVSRLGSEQRWRVWFEASLDVAVRAPEQHWGVLRADLKYGARAFLATPAFAAIVLFVIALGIGSTVSVFSVVNAVLLRSLPYGHAERLVYLWSPNVNFKGIPEELGPSVPDVYDWQRLSQSFSSIALLRQTPLNVVRNGTTTRVAAAFVTGGFFRTLQAWPALGRSLTAGDDRPGHSNVAVISNSFWHAYFGAAKDVLGKQIRLNRALFTVVGVMPEEFGYPFNGDIPYDRSGFNQTDLWLPIAYTARQKVDRQNFESAIAIGRLREGVSAAAAQAELNGIEARLQNLYPQMWRGWRVLARPLVETILGPVQKMLWLLFGAVGVVLLIACANVAGLLLARASARMHELGIRTALGADRSRLVRQLLTESLLLSCSGGALGVALAYGLVHFLSSLKPGAIPRFAATSVDGRVLAFAVLLSIAVGLAAGLLPAISSSRQSITGLLKRGGSRTAGSSNQGRFSLIVFEVALSVVLLTGASLLIRSYLKVTAVDPGFSPATLTLKLHLDERYDNPQLRSDLCKRFLEKLQHLPGFKYAGSASVLPLSDQESVASMEIRGFGTAKEMIGNRNVTADYRKALGTPLLRGRDFSGGDVNAKPPVILVNRKFVDSYFGGREPLGGQVRIGVGDLSSAPWLTVVGVVGDIRHNTLEEASKPQIFQLAAAEEDFAVRCEIPSRQAADEARLALRSLDPALTLEAATMQERIQDTNARRTFQTSLLTAFAAVAVALALVGLYGLLSYTVKQRRSEIAIRLAIGSPRTEILTLLLSQGLRWVGYGLLIGLVGSLALTRLVSSWLFGVGATDSLTFGLVPLFLLLASSCACLIPAWTASRIDPMQALRQE